MEGLLLHKAKKTLTRDTLQNVYTIARLKFLREISIVSLLVVSTIERKDLFE